MYRPIVRYNLLISSSHFCIGQFYHSVLSSDSLIDWSFWGVQKSDFWVGRKFWFFSRPILFLVLGSDFCINRLCGKFLGLSFFISKFNCAFLLPPPTYNEYILLPLLARLLKLHTFIKSALFQKCVNSQKLVLLKTASQVTLLVYVEDHCYRIGT